MTTTRVNVEDSFEAVGELLYSRGMTDGLPVVPPTEERVAAMVAASGRNAADDLGEMPPLNAPSTIEKIAVNSVMAGCDTSYMPAMVTLVEAILDPAFAAAAIQTTTNPVGPMIIFNGPIRNELALNCGAGCFGPGTRANATIGRALRLIMLNVGAAAPGEVDKAVLGWPGKYNCCCIGENEEDSPWEPLHVERGFKAEDSTVTVLPVNAMWAITEMSSEHESVLHHVAHGMATSGHIAVGGPEGFENVCVISPVIAEMIAQLKPTKEKLKQHIFESARIPIDWFPPNRQDQARQRMEQLGLDMSDGRVPVCPRPEDFIIVCAGGHGGLQSCGLSSMLGRSVTKKIEKP